MDALSTMAEHLNQAIADALVERQLRASRVEAGWRADLLAALAVLDMDIVQAIKLADPTEFVLLTRRRREVEALMEETLAPLILAWFARTGERFDTLMGRLANNEAAAVERIVNSEADAEVIEEVPSDASLRRRVAGALFPSASKPTDLSTTGRDWWTRQGQSLTQRLNDTLQVSVSQEESLTQMTQRVRGTSDNGFRDGVMERARQDASRLLTTQVTNSIAEGRVAVAQRNPQRLVLIHQSVLDSRTSIVCLGRNGLKYDAETLEGINHSIPYLNGPPYHANCRSSMVTALDDGGPVSDQTLTQWLKNRDTAFQDEVLGPTRAKMFRAGTLGSPRNLLDSLTGRPLTLEELGA